MARLDRLLYFTWSALQTLQHIAGRLFPEGTMNEVLIVFKAPIWATEIWPKYHGNITAQKDNPVNWPMDFWKLKSHFSANSRLRGSNLGALVYEPDALTHSATAPQDIDFCRDVWRDGYETIVTMIAIHCF